MSTVEKRQFLHGVEKVVPKDTTSGESETSLRHLHFPRSCVCCLPVPCSCGDVPLCLWVLRAQANDLQSCLLTHSTGTKEISVLVLSRALRLCTVTGYWSQPAQSCLCSDFLPTYAGHNPQQTNAVPFFQEDPEIENPECFSLSCIYIPSLGQLP